MFHNQCEVKQGRKEGRVGRCPLSLKCESVAKQHERKSRLQRLQINEQSRNELLKQCLVPTRYNLASIKHIALDVLCGPPILHGIAIFVVDWANDVYQFCGHYVGI